MKEITAIIRPEKLDAVCEALEAAGYPALTIAAVDGKGKEKPLEENWRGERFERRFFPKLQIRLLVRNSDAMEAVDAILQGAKTGLVGDGKITVRAIEQVYRIRTGESGEDIL